MKRPRVWRLLRVKNCAILLGQLEAIQGFPTNRVRKLKDFAQFIRYRDKLSHEKLSYAMIHQLIVFFSNHARLYNNG